MNAGKSAGGGQRRSSPAPPAVSSRNLQNLTKNNTTIASSTTSLISGAQVQQGLNITTKSISSLESSHKVNEKQQPQQQKSMHLTTTLAKSSGDKEGALITNVKKLAPLRKQEEEVLSTNFNSTDNNDKKDICGRKRLNTEQYQHPPPQHQQHLLMNTTNSIKLVTTNTATTSTSGVKKITTGTVLGLTKNVAVTVLAPITTIRSSEPTTKRLKIENRIRDNNEDTIQTTATAEEVLISEIGNSLKSIADTTTNALKDKDYGALEKRILAQKFSRLRSLKDKHSEHVAELFYLQTSGNMMDYPAWRKKPPTPQLFSFNNAYRLEYLVNEAKLAASLKQQQADVPQLQMNNDKSSNSQNNNDAASTTTTNTTNIEILNTEQLQTTVDTKTSTQENANSVHGCHNVINQPLNAEIKIPAVGATPVAVSTKLPAAVAQLSQQGHIPGRPLGGRHGMVFGQISTPNAIGISSVPLVPGGTPLLPCNNSSGSSAIKRSNSTRHITSSPPSFTISTQKSTTGTTDSRNHLHVGSSGGSNGASAGNGTSTSSSAQLEFTNKAKQEVYVMQRVSELQREGLWTEKRLPKLTEPCRVKSHWDYLLEEMVWLAADFAQERKWKKNAAKKCAKMVQKYFHDKANAAQKAEKAQEAQLRRVANFISKEVKMFWSNVEKLVEYKHFAKLEEKRKQALDQHLSFIVDQTEKYSQQLAEGMNKSIVETTVIGKRGSSTNSSNTPALRNTAHNSDDEFLPASGSEDDEETIAKAEEEAKDVKAEVTALKRESQMEIDDFLKDLPKGYLENRSKLIAEEQEEKSSMQFAEEDDDDNEFEASGTSGDDEDTIVEQEKKERNVDYKKEIDELEADNDLSVEQLLQKYNSNNKLGQSKQMELDSDDDVDQEEVVSSDNETEAVNNDTDSDTCEESDEEVETDAESEENEDGLKTLFDEHNESSGVGSKDDMIKDAAALAESIQPKGNTLSSTNVVTPVPFLLKHSLREYQHIGLDWLVTMYERKLNGILADEMGLGKTIQTIALLAHLACEKANWGPHLIVVPSSVMLNWEMEFKKWCPGFKILTYYGTQKERKAKRVGWTKPNAFHVCITSYKLVVQDQQSFRRKKWKYLILDEAQNIKNFKSQRWQLLLNFSTERRLLLTGTPLQNDLMELWSLMHFLMPHVFSSHREFKEWFSNPMTGMIEGNLEYNETLISRLHKVIRPFLLRRLKKEVEKQMPSKYEHVIMCRLSNRQRYLYDDFMSRAKTKETLQTGNLLSVINVLMQLRKVCNHPNMFEVRPIISPFQMEGISLQLPGLVYDIFQHDPFTDIHLHLLNLDLLRLELMMTAYVAYKMRQLAPMRKLIEEVDTSVQNLAPTCPKSKYRFHIRIRDQSVQKILSKHSTFQVQVGASPTMKKTEGNHLVPACSSLLPFSSRIKPLVNLNKINPIHSSSEIIMLNSPTKDSTEQQQPPPLAALRSTSSSSSLVATEDNFRDSAENKILNQSTLITTMGSNDNNNITAAQSDVLVNQIAQHVRTSIKPTTGSTQKDIINLNATINVDDLDVYNMQEIYSQRKQQRLDRLKLMATNNERRTTAAPIYGADCRTAMKKLQEPTSTLQYSTWQIRSSFNCGLAMTHREETWVLNKILRSYAQRCEYLEQACSNFILFVPKASAKRPQLYVSKLSSTQLQTQTHIDETVQREMSPKLSLLHPIISAMTTQFPDPRLIQYDCGKLQTLDKLLRQLKSGQHRVLIFTQMTKMLDVLEAFLNYHGHIYLRLDGSTRVEQRQLLMERFNGDKRIFCFILSTRSGGVGINLTGADTVIFYDSDWNPTMDAQAQDRCHRIGQTRDVHIYRLVSEKTIEVNILQKANQKRMLSDMAIEGGNFTTTFFKSSTIKDLFNVEQMEQQIESTSNSQDTATTTSVNENEKLSLKVFENALAEAEDEQDVQATKTARAEAAADLAEFDETIPIEDSNNENVTSAVTASGQEMSKVDLEMQNLVKQLSPIERYAMRFVEEIGAVWSEAQLKAAEAEIEAQKREWEANRLAVRQKEEEMLQREAEEAKPEDLLTYSRRDANNQFWICQNTLQLMPIWCPPTPPQDNNDLYIDYSLGYMYELTCIPQTELPPVYVRRDMKRSRSEAGFVLDGNRRPAKLRREENVNIPRSLFDRPSAVIARIRRDLKNQRYRGVFKPNVQIPGLRPPLQLRPLVENECSTEWNIFEDIAILHVIVNLQGLPCNLLILSPGHTPNWDLVAEIVNHCSKTYRSPKQCRWRYESVIQPREEGKLSESPKKQKKLKVLTKSDYLKTPLRYLRTTQMFANDGNNSFIKMMRSRFDAIKTAYLKKAPPPKRQYSVPSSMNPKHMEVLQEFGVLNYDQPISPLNVALARASKLREKQRGQIQQAGGSQIVGSTTVQVQQQQTQQQQIQEFITNFNQQQQTINSVTQHLQQFAHQTQSTATGNTAIVLQHTGNSPHTTQLLQRTSSISAANPNVPTQIVKAIVASSSNALQHLPTQPIQHPGGITTSPTVSVVLTSNVHTLSASGTQQVVPTSGTQIMTMTPQPTLVSTGTPIVQSLPTSHASMPQVVSVSQISSVGTVISTSATSIVSPATVTTLNASALRGQRIVNANTGALQDVVLHQRTGNAGQTIVSMASIGQTVLPGQFQAAQLRLTSIAGTGNQHIVTKSIPVSSLQSNTTKLTTSNVLTTGGQQPTQIHLYRHRPGQMVQTQVSGTQTILGNVTTGTTIQGNIIHGQSGASIQLQGQKMPVSSLTAATGNVAGTQVQSTGNSIATVQLATNQGRTQFIKQVTPTGKHTITRQLNEADMLLVKRQMISSQQKAQILQQSQVAQGSIAGTQQGGTIVSMPQAMQQITAVVKTSGGQITAGGGNTVNVVGNSVLTAVAASGNSPQLSTLSQLKPNQIKVTMANQAQMRQLQLQQQQLNAPRKLGRMTQITAAPTNPSTNVSAAAGVVNQTTSNVISTGIQLNSPASSGNTNNNTQGKILTSTGSVGSNSIQAQLVHIHNTKTLPNSVTVQQIQQVMRQNQAGGLSATGLVFGKTSVGRVIPVSVATQANQRQTFQVVSASSAQALNNTSLRGHVGGTQNIGTNIKMATNNLNSNNNSGGNNANNNNNNVNMVSSQSTSQQALITAIHNQAAVQQSQRQNTSPVRLQAMSTGSNLVTVMQQQQQQQQQQQISQSTQNTNNNGKTSISASTVTSSTDIGISAQNTNSTLQAQQQQQQQQKPQQICAIVQSPASTTATQQVRSLVKKKIMQIRNDVKE